MKEQGEERYISTVPSDTALNGAAVNATPWPLHPGNDPVPFAQKASWALGLVWRGTKKPARTGIGFPAHLGRREWLYPVMPRAEITATL